MLLLKNVHHFLHIQLVDIFVNEANHIYIAMAMYNLIAYSDNYSDTSGSLWQFKRDEVPADHAELTINNSQSFTYKPNLLGKTANYNDGKSFVKDIKIVVSLKYLSKVNCKAYLELNWIENCIFSSAGDYIKFEITDAKLLKSTKDSANLTKQLNEGFKRSSYWNSYETKPAKVTSFNASFRTT